jgi:hypothetical protein
MLGLSNKRIASQLAVAVGTVKTHVKSILLKLDAASRTEAVAIAQRRGILQEGELPHPPVRVPGLGGRLSVRRRPQISRNPRKIPGGLERPDIDHAAVNPVLPESNGSLLIGDTCQ